MFLDEFHTRAEGLVCITPEQASRFAKGMAGDFNPLHDADASRFCVPGDLLFSLVLCRYGLSERMRFTFTGMVGAGVRLHFPEQAGEHLEISDENGKCYMRVQRQGRLSTDARLVERFARDYVAFSGHNFPHILVPLMAEQQVMISPDRPLVIYESMSFELERVDLAEPTLELAESKLEVQGRRGVASLNFRILCGGQVGSGSKKLLLSGLRPYEQAAIDDLVRRYNERSAAYGALR
jgi:hypothetical protein